MDNKQMEADLKVLKRVVMDCNAFPDQLPALQRLYDSTTAVREALAMCLSTIEDYLEYRHDGDPWVEDARLMGEMDINRLAKDGRLEAVKRVLGELKDES